MTRRRAFVMFVIVHVAFAAALPASAIPPQLSVILSGHSLTDPIPDPLTHILQSAGQRSPVIARSTIPGSPMDWRWNHVPDPSMPNAREPAIMAQHDVLVMTERVSLSGTMPWHGSEQWALHWAEHAWENGRGGNGAATVLYATWVPITSGPDYENPYDDPEGLIPFRERLDLELERWREIQDHVNANLPDAAPRMRMIPGTTIMAGAYDAIAAGQAPGLSSIADLFHDEIHLSDKGAFLMALAHYAVLFEQDPRGLPLIVLRPAQIDAELGQWMKQLVYEHVFEQEFVWAQ